MSTTSVYFSVSVKDHTVLECGPYVGGPPGKRTFSGGDLGVWLDCYALGLAMPTGYALWGEQLPS